MTRLTAQETGRCSNDGCLVIDAGTGTDIAQLLPANPYDNTGSCLVVNGVLRVSGTFTITGGEIRMQPGSQIIIEVAGHLRLIDVSENGGLHGCFQMWKGISFMVNPNSASAAYLRLTLVNTLIQDAEYAVAMQRRSALYATNSIFNRNYIGVFADGGVPSSPVVITPPFTSLSGCTFSSTGTMLAAYAGQTHYAPRTYAGVFGLNNPTFAMAIGANAGQANQFKDISNGILGVNCRYEIANNIFENIRSGETSAGFFPVDLTAEETQSNAIYVQKAAALANIRHNQFVNCMVGLQAESATFNFDDNTMDNTSFGVIAYNLGGRTARVRRNDMDCTHGAVLWSTIAANRIEILDNTIVSRPILAFDTGIGVAINYMDVSGNSAAQAVTGTHLVDENTIEIQDFDGETAAGGILVTAGGVYIRQNTVKMGNYGEAIGVAMAKNGIIAENIVETQTTEYVFGIYVKNSPNISVTCNDVKATGHALVFEGDCGCSGTATCTRISGNSLVHLTPPAGTASDGLQLYYAVTSPQDKQGNQWLGIDPNDPENFGASYWGDALLAFTSMFIVHTNQLPYHPQTIWVDGGMPGDWFATQSGNYYECSQMVVNNPSGVSEDIFEIVADGGLSAYGAGAQWMAGRNLLQAIQAEPVLLGNPALQSFYTTHQNGESGLLSAVEEGLASLDRKPAGLQNTLDSLDTAITELTADWIEKEGQVSSLQPNAPAYLVQELELIELNLQAVVNQRDSLESGWAAQRQSAINGLIAINSGITATSLPAVNKKELLTVALDMLAAGRAMPNAGQKQALESIAAWCPAEGGEAIYQAYSLLHRFYYPTTCREALENRSQAPQQEEKPIEIVISLYPNPNRGELTLVLGPSSAQYNFTLQS
ncbi:MAG: hypothetical protein JNK77_20570, partial [Saprospiraceae bacterium]|nr:hypothetical protein [Saprospiraceae bacterium]